MVLEHGSKRYATLENDKLVVKDGEIMQQLLNDVFNYKDGKIYWKVKTSKKVIVGNEAGSMTNGYLITRVHGKSWYVHRIIFLMHHGYLPKCIDHINGIKNDNRIENLRAASVSENGFNVKTKNASKSGMKHVRFHQNKWCVQMRINGIQTHIGSYETVDEAILSVKEARAKHHGDFARHG